MNRQLLQRACLWMLLSGVAFANIGLPPEVFIEAVGGERIDAVSMRTPEGLEVQLVTRGTALASVYGAARLDEPLQVALARVIAAATGYFEGIQAPVEGFLAQNLSTYAGVGPVSIGVEAFRLRLEVVGAAAPFEVAWALTLNEVPEADFLPVRHALGPADARYVIREFSDLMCPFCARYAFEVLPALKETLLLRGDVRFEYHHLVLGGRFVHTQLAAEVLECVADANPSNPDAFWIFLDALFDRQAAWSALEDPLPQLLALPEALGLSNNGVLQCLAEGRHRGYVQASSERAFELGISGTPTIFVGGLRLQSFSQLAPYLDAMAILDAFADSPAVAAP